MRRFVTLLRALAAMLAVGVILVGSPIALALLGGNPLHAHIPTLKSVERALSTPDNGTLFLHALAGIGWLVWLSIAVAVAVEIRDQLRGLGTRRLPALGPQQRLAAALITAIVLGFSSPVLAAAVPTRAAAAVTSTVPAGPTAQDTASSPSYFTHSVARGETLASIARLYLGDPLQYQHIIDASVGIVEPGGTAVTRTTTSVDPGWTLRVPVSAIAVVPQIQPGPEDQVLTADGTTTLQQLLHKAGVTADWRGVYERNRGATEPDGAQLFDPQHLQSGWTVVVPAAAHQTQLTYHVTHGDWLYYIAQRYLGDGDLYPTIAALNPQYAGRHNADETRYFPDHIEPSWTLRLPAGAYDHGANAHANGHAAGAGDAGTAGGTSGATVSPTPANHVPASTPTPAPSAAASPAATSGAAVTPPTTPTTTATPTPVASAAASPAPTSAATTPAGAIAPTPAASGDSQAPSSTPSAATTGLVGPTADNGDKTNQTQSASDDEPIVIVAALASATLVATLAGAALIRRRRRAASSRPTGQRAKLPRQGVTDIALATVAQPVDIELVDQALRHLAANLIDREEVPDPIAITIDGDVLSLLLARPCADPPHPWTAKGATWNIPADAELVVPADAVPPLPLIAAIGSRPGSHLLLDLERAGVTALIGAAEHTGDLLRYLASELACNIWSDDVEVIMYGFDIAEAEQLVAMNPGRVRVTANLAETVNRLTRRAAGARDLFDQDDLDGAFAARIADVAADAWMPQVLLVHPKTRVDLDALDGLSDVLARAGRCGVAAIAALTPDQLIDATIVQLNDDRTVTSAVGPYRLTANAAGLPLTELEPLAEALTAARQYEPAPPSVETEEWAQGTDSTGHLLDDITEELPIFGDEYPSPEPDDQDSEPLSEKPLVLAVTSPVRRITTAAVRRRSNSSDPDLDDDLAAWHDPVDGSRPRIGILGPITIRSNGTPPAERARFQAEIIVYFAQRGARGATADQFSEAMWPEQLVKGSSLRTAISRARVWLGYRDENAPWLAEVARDKTYRITEGFLLDWHLFRRLRCRAEQRGPAGGKDIRAALELVRGAPLEGATQPWTHHTRPPFPWLAASEIYPFHLTAAIVDAAHDYTQLALDHGDHAAARWAIDQAWAADVDRDNDQPWRDLLRVTAAEGRQHELTTIVEELLRVRDLEVPEDLPLETLQVIDEVLPSAQTTRR